VTYLRKLISIRDPAVSKNTKTFNQLTSTSVINLIFDTHRTIIAEAQSPKSSKSMIEISYLNIDDNFIKIQLNYLVDRASRQRIDLVKNPSG
jgi:hypothetical protein